MLRRTPRSTRTDTLFPYTTLFRSALSGGAHLPGEMRFDPLSTAHVAPLVAGRFERVEAQLGRSEEHTSELQSLMRISYAVFCLKNIRLLYDQLILVI